MTKLYYYHAFNDLFNTEGATNPVDPYKPFDMGRIHRILREFGVEEPVLEVALELPQAELIEFIVEVGERNQLGNLRMLVDDLEEKLEFLIECHNEPCEEHAEAARIKGLAQ